MTLLSFFLVNLLFFSFCNYSVSIYSFTLSKTLITIQKLQKLRIKYETILEKLVMLHLVQSLQGLKIRYLILHDTWHYTGRYLIFSSGKYPDTNWYLILIRYLILTDIIGCLKETLELQSNVTIKWSHENTDDCKFWYIFRQCNW